MVFTSGYERHSVTRNAPVKLQRIMTQVLRGLVVVNADDILGFSRNFDDHWRYLEKVFSRHRDSNLAMKYPNASMQRKR